jgi:hypothetical protein
MWYDRKTEDIVSRSKVIPLHASLRKTCGRLFRSTGTAGPKRMAVNPETKRQGIE